MELLLMYNTLKQYTIEMQMYIFDIYFHAVIPVFDKPRMFHIMSYQMVLLQSVYNLSSLLSPFEV